MRRKQIKYCTHKKKRQERTAVSWDFWINKQVPYLFKNSIYSVCLMRPVLIIIVWKHCRSIAQSFTFTRAGKKTRQGENEISKKCPNCCCELQRKTMSGARKRRERGTLPARKVTPAHGLSMHGKDWEILAGELDGGKTAWKEQWEEGKPRQAEGERGFGVSSWQSERFRDIF